MALPSQGTILKMGKAVAGDALTTVAVEEGYPTVFTKAAHGLTAGRKVTCSAFSNAKLDTLSAVVQFVTDDTFALALDTTGETIGTGTVTPETYWTIGEVVDCDRAAGDRTEIDTTHLTSTSKEYLMGLRDGGTFTFSVNFLFDDDGQAAVREAEASDDSFHWLVEYPSGNTCSFDGFVKSFSGPSADVDGKLSGSVNVKVTGDVVFA
jgi:hypothetical protein